MFDLSGKVALVTGSGRGVGAGIAAALAGAGASVAVNDLDAGRAGETAAAVGGRPFVGDVTDAASLAAMVADISDQLGPIDILVNNAGIPAAGFDLKPFLDTTREEWDRFIRLNLYGVMECVAAVLPGMVERGNGRIITISSEAGRLGAGVGVSLYGAAKAGAVGFSRSLAHEVARKGVTVNCVSLGLIDNTGANASDPALGARSIPVKRLGTPDDVGAAVLYLASTEAAWVTGQNLPVNGGLSAT